MVIRDTNCNGVNEFNILQCIGIEDNQENVSFNGIYYYREFFALARINNDLSPVRISDTSVYPLPRSSSLTDVSFECAVDLNQVDLPFKCSTIDYSRCYRNVDIIFFVLLCLFVLVLFFMITTTNKSEHQLKAHGDVESGSSCSKS